MNQEEFAQINTEVFWETIKSIKSVCPRCNGRGVVQSEKGPLIVCPVCKSNNHLSWDELYKLKKEEHAVKKTRESSKTREEYKREN